MGLFGKSRKAPGWLAFGFSESAICAAHIERAPAALPKVSLAQIFPLPGAVEAGQLEKFGKEIHAARFQCTTFLAAGEYQILSVEAPNVPAEELKTAVRWRLKDMLDFHVDDATIDVLDIPPDKGAPVRAHSMYAIAARNQLIEQRQNLFADAKIPLLAIDIPELAQRNISVLMEAEGRGMALLSFDSEGGLLTVSYKGELYLARRIDIPIERLTGDPTQADALYERIGLEVQRSLDHFDRQFNFITLSRLAVFPPGQVGTALQRYLKDNLDIPVEVLHLETMLDFSGVPELNAEENQARYFKVLGAALRHEEKAL
jgi:MSHA biogenesis protein MshI